MSSGELNCAKSLGFLLSSLRTATRKAGTNTFAPGNSLPNKNVDCVTAATRVAPSRALSAICSASYSCAKYTGRNAVSLSVEKILQTLFNASEVPSVREKKQKKKNKSAHFRTLWRLRRVQQCLPLPSNPCL